MKLFRCSSLHKLIGDGRSKAAVISDTAKSAIRDIVKEDLYGFRSFTGNQYTQKGNLLEDLAIEMSGKMRFRNYQKQNHLYLLLSPVSTLILDYCIPKKHYHLCSLLNLELQLMLNYCNLQKQARKVHSGYILFFS